MNRRIHLKPLFTILIFITLSNFVLAQNTPTANENELSWFVIIGGLILIGIVGYLAYYFSVFGGKKEKAKELLEELEQEDKVWSMDDIKARVEAVFADYHKALSHLDMKFLEGNLSEKVEYTLDNKIGNWKAKNKKPVFKNLRLRDVKIIGVTDYDDDSKDSFNAQILGSKYEYFVDAKTGEKTFGDGEDLVEIQEIWQFLRVGDSWVLNEIDHDVTMGDLKDSKFFKEGKEEA